MAFIPADLQILLSKKWLNPYTETKLYRFSSENRYLDHSSLLMSIHF